MKNTVVALEEAGFRNSVKIIVGGAPVTRAFADEIGADGYGYDSPGAAQRCKELVLGKIWTFAFEVEDLGINIIVEEF